MTERLNYSTHAIEDMVIVASQFIHKGHQISDPEERSTTFGVGFTARDIIELLWEAEKFILPDWGRIFTADEWAVIERDVELPRRLPYPVVALEYPCNYDPYPLRDPENETESSKRIALVVEAERLKSLKIDNGLKLAATTNPAKDQEGYFIFPIAYSDIAEVWTPPPCGIFMPREGKTTRASMHNGSVVIDYLTEHLVTLALGIPSYEKYEPGQARAERMAKDLGDELIAVAHMQAALSLDKGRHEVSSAPTKLNKKRAKKSKPPMFEYKVLDIVADVMAPQKEQSNGSQREGRSHASPRMHSRRGHVRKLASGKTTWVRNTIVGKPTRGRIIKDYSVHE